MKWYIYLIILMFLGDVIYRTFIKKKINKNLDFNKIIQETNKNKNANNSYNLTNQSLIDNNKNNKNDNNKLKYRFYKHKENILNEDNEDEDEFGSVTPIKARKINITVEYSETYKKLNEELQLNLTQKFNKKSIKYYNHLVQQDTLKYYISWILYISNIGCTSFFFFSNIILKMCCKLSEKANNIFSSIKFILAGLSYLLHMFLIKKFSNSNLFEIYINRQLKYSTLKRGEPPTFEIISNLLNDLIIEKND